MDKQQIDRIIKMESYLDEVSAAVKELNGALDGFEAVRDKYGELVNYYEGSEWRADFEADEEGLLPADLKRGVLSEDAVYDLITDWQELLKRIK